MEQETYLDRIRKLKSSQKITNEKLSEMTGIPLGTLSKLLAGINDSPKLSNVVAISAALNCSLDWLISGVPQNTHNYTLGETEIALIERYRQMDVYGQELVEAVVERECDRTERQSAEEAIRLHDLARHAAGRGGSRVRRITAERAHRADSDIRDESRDRSQEITPEEAGADLPAKTGLNADRIIRGTAGESGTATVLHSLDRGMFAHAEDAAQAAGMSGDEAFDAAAVPPSCLDAGRSTELPAGLRRRHIGLYDLPVSAGVGEFLADSTRTDIVIPDDARTAEADFALRIAGDSMEPRYHTGDVLLVQSTESVEEGELGIFVLDGSGYFKKYGGDRLISLNAHYAPIMLKDFNKVFCCGRVVGKLKRK